jgi:hypothetical protein
MQAQVYLELHKAIPKLTWLASFAMPVFPEFTVLMV